MAPFRPGNNLVITGSSTATADATTILWDYGTTASDSALTINYPTQITVPLELPKRLPPPREFNKFINASDMLKEFIRWLGEQGVRQKEVYELPIEYFIKWLVLEACEADQEEPNLEMPALPAPKYHRCLGCGQFMAWAILLPIHVGRCVELYFARQAVDA